MLCPCIIFHVCSHHYQLFLVLFIVFNDGFIIEIMIILYCVYINTTSVFLVLSFLVLEFLSFKALDPIMSSAANTNHKNDLPTTISVRLDKNNYLLWKL